MVSDEGKDSQFFGEQKARSQPRACTFQLIFFTSGSKHYDTLSCRVDTALIVAKIAISFSLSVVFEVFGWQFSKSSHEQFHTQ
jgi:hypothetical protein